MKNGKYKLKKTHDMFYSLQGIAGISAIISIFVIIWFGAIGVKLALSSIVMFAVAKIFTTAINKEILEFGDEEHEK